MVFERRNHQGLNCRMKKVLAIILTAFFMLAPVSATSAQTPVPDKVIAASSAKEPSKNASEVLKGSVSVDITPYYANWSSKEAYNHINRIGTNLIQSNNIEKHIEFVVSEDKDANAYANMKDVITVNMGLLKYVETEDELAYVIGHEMGHVTKTHVKKGYARNIVIATAAIAGTTMTVLGATSNSAKMSKTGMIVTGGAVAGKIADKGLSRGAETKADLASVDYLVNAGYNPLASISLMNKISGNYFDIFSDHPSGGKRIKKIYKYISQNYPEYLEKGYNSTSYERALQYINKK